MSDVPASVLHAPTVVFTRVLGAMHLPSRNGRAFALTLALFLAATRAVRRRAPRRGPLRLPLRARPFFVLAFVACELVLVFKPLFGFTKRFGWRMFAEELELRAPSPSPPR